MTRLLSATAATVAVLAAVCRAVTPTTPPEL